MPSIPQTGRLNMQQIADAAGVSKSAVSLALKNDPRLPESTRQRIQDLAHKMGYQRNPVMASLMAQLRASKAPKYQATIAWLNCNNTKESLEQNTFQEFRQGAERRARELGYMLENFWLWEPGMSLERLRDIFRARNIRGFIAYGLQSPDTLFADEHTFISEFSCGVVGRANTRLRLPSATVDHYLTAKLAVDTILEHGYQRPGLVVKSIIDVMIDGKFSAGFYTATKHLPSKDRIPEINFDPEKPETFLTWYRKHQPDVIVTVHDKIREWLESDGVNVPEDVALVHLDIAPNTQDWSGMKQPNRQVGAYAAEMVIEQMTRAETGPHPHPKAIMISSNWVDGTTAPAKAEA